MRCTEPSGCVCRRAAAWLACVLVTLTAGAGAVSAAETLVGLPASFEGVLPCADCEGIRHHLDLFSDGSFFYRLTYLGRAAAFDDIGTFSVDDEGSTLTLAGGREAPVLFRLVDSATLRKLDLDGHEIENTYWKLTQLGGEPVVVGDGRREPFLVLSSIDGRLAAFNGCNRVTGSYQVTGSAISFGQLASTMMACVEGMEYERPFAQTLERATSWRITGEQLELRDEGGNILARFEARPMP